MDHPAKSQPSVNVLLGGEGLIGSALRRRLEAIGEKTVTYDLKSGFDLRHKDPDPFPRDGYCWFLAWDVGGAKYIMDPAAQISILKHNWQLCERIFGWIEKRKTRFTFVSTQMVGHPNAYGVAKAVGECWARNVGGGLISRLWNVYDAEEPSRKSHVIPDLIQQAVKGEIRLQTSGVERRQFLHADDCAEALILQRDAGQILAEITTGEWIPVRRVADLIAEMMGAAVVPGPRAGYESLVEPAHPLPGWGPRIDLRTGLRRVVEAMRRNGWC
jgi:nucleoside-diphosphate-sugar epimerase